MDNKKTLVGMVTSKPALQTSSYHGDTIPPGLENARLMLLLHLACAELSEVHARSYYTVNMFGLF